MILLVEGISFSSFFFFRVHKFVQILFCTNIRGLVITVSRTAEEWNFPIRRN